MPFEWFVALRYLRDAKGQTALILAAVSVGVSVVVFLSALINGLQVSLVDKTLGSQPHVSIRVPREAPRPLTEPTSALAITRNVQASAQRLRSIDQWPVVMTGLEHVPGVTAVSATVSGAGFAIRGDAKAPILVTGIDPERFLAIIDVRKKTVAGRFEVAGDDVVIGSVLASDLGVGVGDKLRVTTTEGGSDTVTIAGIFTLGNRAVDQTWVVTSLRHAQSLYALPGGVTTIDIKVADVFDAERVAGDVRDRTAEVEIDSDRDRAVVEGTELRPMRILAATDRVGTIVGGQGRQKREGCEVDDRSRKHRILPPNSVPQRRSIRVAAQTL